jgi:lipopolysaccharide transport system permease protein
LGEGLGTVYNHGVLLAMTEPLSPSEPELPIIEIGSRQPWLSTLSEAWAYRELLLFLIWRDLKVRYKQTVLGVVWGILQPLGLMVVFTIFLGRLALVPSDGLPYAIFVLAGLVSWQLFAAAVNDSSTSLVANERLITKVYFPRILIPIAAVLVALADFAVGSLLIAAMILWYGVFPGIEILLAPLFVLMAVFAALGVGLWLSALNVRYRDTRYVLGFMIQVWMFVTPVVYPMSIVPPQWRPVLAFNPMASVVEGFRWTVLGAPPPSASVVTVSAASTIIIVLSGLVYFRYVEDSFADVI